MAAAPSRNRILSIPPAESSTGSSANRRAESLKNAHEFLRRGLKFKLIDNAIEHEDFQERFSTSENQPSIRFQFNRVERVSLQSSSDRFQVGFFDQQERGVSALNAGFDEEAHCINKMGRVHVRIDDVAAWTRIFQHRRASCVHFQSLPA